MSPKEPEKQRDEVIKLTEFYELAEKSEQQIIVNNYVNSTIIHNHNSPDEGTARFIDSKKASWFFGGSLVFLLGYLVLAGPADMPAYRLMLLGHLTSICSGLFAFFFTGQLGLDAVVKPPAFIEKVVRGKVGVRAIGGAAIWALTLILWSYTIMPTAHGAAPASTVQSGQSK